MLSQTILILSLVISLLIFLISTNFNNGFVLDKNPIKELHNPLPNFQKFPFKLKKNEAIISYKVDKKIKYFRISDLKKEWISFSGNF